VEAVRKPRLRVGVFADSAFQPRWLVESLAAIAGSDYAEITAIALAPGGTPRSEPLLWQAYGRVDRALFGGSADWSARRDLALLVPRERRVAMDDASCCWKARIRDARLDVAFVAGDLDIAPLEGLARHGTWRFCFGEGHGTCEPLAAVREVVTAHPVMASGIRIHLGDGRPDRIACQSWSRTSAFSIARSRDTLFAKTGQFLARALRDLHAGGAAWIEHGTEPASDAAAERFPAAGGLLRDIGTLGARVARRAAEKALTVEEWSIAFRFSDEESWSGSLEGFHRLDPPKGGFWADPFPIQVNGRNYIFFEELPAGADKAHICVVEVDRQGRASPPVKVLERPYHLSYPFLIEEEGRLYMIPETANNNTVEIYRCVEFPAKWKLERVLMNGVFCADATLHREGDRWWMFANAASAGGDINDELHLYSADRLLGDWTPHRRNPVKSDVRSSRPAGRLFRRGNRLYRPGQIGAPRYGSGIALHHVTRLTQDEYLEEEDRRIVPPACDARGQAASEAILGIHTINRAGDLSVTDAFRRRSRF
jgi:hypothetical protein